MSEFTRDRVKGFLHADGRRMVNGDGEEVILRGWSMGNWSNPEGWMVGELSIPHSSIRAFLPVTLLVMANISRKLIFL